MNKIYIVAGLGLLGLFLGGYWAGNRAGHAACQAAVAVQQQTTAAALQNELNFIKGEINEETYHTGVVDIRQRLRDKYSIKD